MDDDNAVASGQAGRSSTGGLVVDHAAAEESFAHLPLPQQLAHSNWKARRDGLDAIASSPAEHMEAFFTALPKLLKESNASAIESFLDAAGAVLGAAGEREVLGSEDGILKLLAEKGITGRPRAVTASNTILKVLVERAQGAAANNAHAAAVGTALMTAFGHKTPKNRQASAQAFATLIESFGPSLFPMKAILKALVPLFNDQNALVRKEAQNLCVQCYRYLGPAVMSFLSDLRDVQQQELQKIFSETPMHSAKNANTSSASAGPSASSTGLSSQRSTQGPADGPQGSHLLPAPPTDGALFGEFDEKAVLSRLPKDFYSVALNKSAKWQDRNTMVRDTLGPLLQAPRLKAADDYTELVKCLRDLLNDPQVPLNTTAFRCVQDLAKGLRERFGAFVRFLIPAIFEKFKEKKTSVLETVHTTIGLFLSYDCCAFEALQEEIDSALGSKIPHHRAAMISWLNNIVPLLPPERVRARLARSPLLAKVIIDDKIEVRDGGLALVGKIAAMCGDAALGGLMASLSDQQAAKAQAGGQEPPPSSASAAPAAARMAAAGPSGPGNRRASAVAGHPSALPQASAAAAPRIQSSSAAAAGPAGAGPTATRRVSTVGGAKTAPGGGRAPAHDTDDAVSLESSMPTSMDATNALAHALGDTSDVLNDLGHKEWKKRQDAVLAIETAARLWDPSTCAQLLDHVVIVLKTAPGWKESIFQVSTAMLSLLTFVTDAAHTVTPRAAYSILAGLAPKLSDMKCRQPLKELLTVLAQGVGPRFVTRHVLNIIAPLKQPKLLTEVLDWIVRALVEFERAPVEAKTIVDFVRAQCFDAQPPAIRAAGIAVVVALRARTGPRLDAFFQDLNPHLKASIEQEVAKGIAPLADVTIRSVKPTANEQEVEPLSAAAAQQQQQPAQPQRVAAEKPVRQAAQAQQAPTRAPAAAPSRSGQPSPASAPLGHGPSSRPATTNSTPQQLALEAPPQILAGSSSGERVDVAHLLAPLARDISAGNDWKVRLAAVKKMETLLQQYRGIGPAGVGDAMKALRGRFDEVNKNFVVDVLRTMCALVEAAGPAACRGAIKTVLPAVLGFLGDQKQQLREEATRFAAAGFDALGVEAVLPMLPKALSAEAQFARAITAELVEGLVARQGPDVVETVSPRLVGTIVVPVLRLLMDRIADIRQRAESILAFIMEVIGSDAVMKHVLELKPAEQQQVRLAVDRAIDICLARAPQEGGAEQQEEDDDNPSQSFSPQPPAAVPRALAHEQLQQHDPTQQRLPFQQHPQYAAGASAPQGSRSQPPQHLQAAVLASAGGPRPVPSPVAPSALPSGSYYAPMPDARAAVDDYLPQAAATTSGPLPPVATPSASRLAAAPAATAAKKPREGGTNAGDGIAYDDILQGIANGTNLAANRMCVEFMRRLRTPGLAPTSLVDDPLVLAMVERLRRATNASSPHDRVEGTIPQAQRAMIDEELAGNLIECLSATFRTETAVADISVPTLAATVNIIVDALMSEPPDPLVRGLNSFALYVVSKTPTDTAFRALILSLNDYTFPYTANPVAVYHRYMTLVIKCILRLDVSRLSPLVMIRCAQDFLEANPPSQFKGKDDLPIRTVKTVIQSMVKLHGMTLHDLAREAVGPTALVCHLISAAFDSWCNQQQQQQPAAAPAATRSPALTPSPSAAHVDPVRMQGQQGSSIPSRSPVRGTPQTSSAAAVSPSRAALPPQSRPPPNIPQAPSLRPSVGRQSAELPPLQQQQSFGALTSSHSAPTYAVPASAAAPVGAAKEMQELFTQVRKPDTSKRGIERLYAVICTGITHKDTPAADSFDRCFRECSAPFQVYVARRLAAARDADANGGVVVLPEIVAKTLANDAQR